MLVYPCITPIQTPSRINIGLVVRRAIKKAERLEKEAYLAMGLSEGQWSKAMSRVPGYGIDLHKMMALPWWFWKEFLPLLSMAVMKVWIADLRGDLCHSLDDERDEARGEEEL